MSEPLLSVRGLRVGLRRRGQTLELVRGVDLDVAAGEKLGIVGESGSGKTLTVLSLLQLLPAPLEILAGSVSFAGEDLRQAAPERLRAGARRGGRDGLPGPDELAQPAACASARRSGRRSVPTAYTASAPARARSRCSATSGCPTPPGWRAPTRTSSPAACCSA